MKSTRPLLLLLAMAGAASAVRADAITEETRARARAHVNAQTQSSTSAADHASDDSPRKAAPVAKPRKAGGKPPLNYLPTKEIAIPDGEIKLLPIPGKIVRVAIGNAAIISNTTVDDNLLVIAENVGNTSLLIWTNTDVYSYRVQVVPKGMMELKKRVAVLTEGLTGVTVEELGTELVIGGVAHKDALRRLAAALANTPNLIFNVREDQGAAYTQSVLFKLHFLEVKRSLIEQIGVQWAKEAAGPVLGAIGIGPRSGLYSEFRQAERGDNLLDPNPPFVQKGTRSSGYMFGLATSITSRLRFGIANGDVRVLSSPELTAKSGGKARFQVGGEIPIPIAGTLGTQTVEFKSYGIIFAFEPVIDANNVITAKISTEMSQIDASVSVNGLPGFLNRSTSTEVSLKRGEMIALSGLINSELSNAVDRVPAISRIPILGRLFRSDDFRNNRSDLVVLLEPEIIQPGQGMAEDLKQRGIEHREEFDKKAEELAKGVLVQPPPVAPITEVAQ